MPRGNPSRRHPVGCREVSNSWTLTEERGHASHGPHRAPVRARFVIPNARWSAGWRSRPVLVAFAVAIVVPAASILLHELGHFAAHAAFGYETNRLTFASVRAGDPPAGVDPVFADGLAFAAGASVSMALVGFALLSLTVLGPNPVVLPLVMFECVRGLVGLVQQTVNAGAGHTLGAGFGELRHAVRAFGGPGGAEIALSWIELGVPLLALVFVIRRTPPGKRVRASIVVFAGLVIGLVLWIGVVGPRLLPA